MTDWIESDRDLLQACYDLLRKRVTALHSQGYNECWAEAEGDTALQDACRQASAETLCRVQSLLDALRARLDRPPSP